MTRADLNEENRKKYDQIVDEMKKELDMLPKSDGNTLDGGKTSGQREIEERYLPRLRELLR